MDQCRDAEPGLLHHLALQPHHVRRALHGRHRSTAEHPRQVAEPIAYGLLDGHRAGSGEHILHGGHIERVLRLRLLGSLHVVAQPPAAELADLLLKGHLGEERLDPVCHGECRVLPCPERPVRRVRPIWGRHLVSSKKFRNFSVSRSVLSAIFRPTMITRLDACSSVLYTRITLSWGTRESALDSDVSQI
ncbi:hypothetical protein GCM10027612_05520 [Microbispora bryophytorum subsp. camponoti]